MASPLIELENVVKSYSGQRVLDNVSFSVGCGEIVTLIGPNGAGKSTLMKIALGLLRADRGRVSRKKDISIGYMPQKISIEENLPLTVAGFLGLRPGSLDIQIREMMAQAHIIHVAEIPIQCISGGEMQRVLLARAMLGNPDLLVLDEPVQGVDIAGQEEIYGLIAQMRREKNCGILMISHDLHMVMAGTDRVICLNRHICCSGAPENIKEHPEYHALIGTRAKSVALYTHHHDHHHDSQGNIVGNVISGEHGEAKEQKEDNQHD